VARVGDVAESSLLVTAKAAGKVTRASRDGVSAVARGALRAVSWTNDLVVSSTKLLNPLTWTKRCTKRRSGQVGEAKAPALSSAPHLSMGHRAGDAAPLTPRPDSAVAGTARPSPASADAPKVIKARDASHKRQARGSKRDRAKRSSRRSGGHAAIPPEVSSEEAAVAEFSSVTDRVMFGRALKNLKSENATSRARAAQILGGIHHRLSTQALSALLPRDPSAAVRRECTIALTALGAKTALPAVERALSDTSSSVRMAAVRGVYRLAGHGGAALLVRMFSDEDEDVRRRAAACLGWLGQEHLAVELRPLLRGQSASVRLAALEAVGNLGSSAVVDDVIEMLDDSEESVQRRAFQVLQTITGKQMGNGFPEDEDGRRFLIARWRAWRERKTARRGS